VLVNVALNTIMTSNEIIANLSRASGGIVVVGLVLMFFGQRNEMDSQRKQYFHMSLQFVGRLMVTLPLLSYLGVPIILLLVVFGGGAGIVIGYLLLIGVSFWWAFSAFRKKSGTKHKIESEHEEVEYRRRVTFDLQEQYAREKFEHKKGE